MGKIKLIPKILTFKPYIENLGLKEKFTLIDDYCQGLNVDYTDTFILTM